MFGKILTWSQERTTPVFFIATANDVKYLPPEFMRKGRVDEIFAVDLPNPDESLEILAIQLKKKKRNPANFDLPKVVENMTNFVGSEIEATVDSAMFSAFDDNERDITTEDLVLAAKEITPLAVTASEQVDALRDWAKSRARWASEKKAVTVTTGLGRRKVGEN
jgi:SpoVK/Ycf46/Vps4 family AAA+-type ATPase